MFIEMGYLYTLHGKVYRGGISYMQMMRQKGVRGSCTNFQLDKAFEFAG